MLGWNGVYPGGRLLSPGDAPPAAEQTAPPRAGEVTGPQPGLSYPLGAGWGDCATGCGADPWQGWRDNPCGFPGYGRLYLGTFDTYRFMTRHPRLAHARGQVHNAIAANSWGWQARPGAPQRWLKFVEDTLGRLRDRFIAHALRSLDFGCASFEKVWEVTGGRYVLAALKPLLVDRTVPLLDEHGGFAGLEVDGDRDGRLGVRKCFHVAYDGEAGDPWGQSRLENARPTCWRDWLDAATDLVRLSRDKITGIIPIIKTPAGSFTDPNGVTIKWRESATTAIRALRNGQGIWFPTLALPDQRTPDNLALAKVSLVDISTVDFGDCAPAVMALLARMAADENLMFASYLRSPRTGMSTQGGTKADAGLHDDTDTTDAERVDAMIADAFNDQVVDDVLVLNFGERAGGAVRAVPAKLRDEHRDTDMVVLNAILADPDLRPQYVEQLDVDALTDRRGLPKLGEIRLEAVPTEPDDNAGGATDPNANDPEAGDGGGAKDDPAGDQGQGGG
jgi:hypothetical protein